MNHDWQTTHFYKPLAKIGLLLATLLSFSGCSLRRPASPPTATWQQHRQQLQQYSYYEARGRLIYQTPQGALYARFTWQQRAADHYRWYLLHPLEQTLLQVTQQKKLLQVVDHQGQRYQGTQAVEWLKQHSGSVWPLNHIAHWLIGLPEPQDRYQMDPQQRIQQLRSQIDPQLQVNYLAYRLYGLLTLPSKLQLQRQKQQITLTINQWSYT